MIKIKYDHTSYSKTQGTIDFNDVESGDAYPTGRLLDGSEDHGYAEEWEEPAQLPDGRKGHLVYLFDDDDITYEDGDPKEAENYPWDEEHVKCFVLDPNH